MNEGSIFSLCEIICPLNIELFHWGLGRSQDTTSSNRYTHYCSAPPLVRGRLTPIEVVVVVAAAVVLWYCVCERN
jgi:hypothetical protein